MLATTVLAPLQSTYAASSSTNLDQDVQKWWYYNALLSCFKDANFAGENGVGTPEGMISDGTGWFGQTSLAGDYMRSASPALSDVGVDGTTACNDGKFVTNALSVLGLGSPIDFVCKTGLMVRADKTNCENSNTHSDFVGTKNSSTQSGAESTAQLWMGTAPSMSNADWYEFYYTSFMNGCANGDKAFSSASDVQGTSGAKINSDSSDNYAYEIATVSGSGENAKMVKTYYSGNVSGNHPVPLYADTSNRNHTMDCGDIAAKIADPAGTLAAGYVKAVQEGADGSPPVTCANGATPDSSGKCPTPSDTTSCNIPGLGWILCPILTTGAQLADSAYQFLAQNFLETNPSLVNTDPKATTQDSNGNQVPVGTGAYTAWKIMVQIANVAFVIAFLIIIFSQLTGAGVNNYGVKKMLPRLIIGAILVNVSFWLCAIAIDISNILGYSLKGALSGVANQVASSGGGAAIGVGSNGSLSGDNSLYGLVGVIITGTAAAAVIWVNLGAVILAMISALLVLLLIFVLLIARQALIVLLVVASPLAFVAYLLPNTETWFTKWRKMLTALLMLFPIIGLLYGACQLASEILLQVSGGNVVWRIAAYMVLVIPLVAVIPLLKGSLDGVGKLGGTIKSFGAKVQGGAKKVGQKAYDNSRLGQYKAYRSGRWAQRRASVQAGTYVGPGGKIRRALNPFTWGNAVNAGLNAASGRFGDQLGNRGAAIEAKEDKELLGNAGARLDTMNFSGKPLTQAQLMQISMKKDVTDASGNTLASAGKFSEHDRRAAIERAVTNASVSDAHNLVNHAGSGKMSLSERKALANAIPGSKVATKAPYLSGRTLSDIMQGNVNANDAALQAINSGKITAEALAGMDKDSVNHLIQVAQNTAPNSPERAVLKAAYGQLSAPGSHLGDRIVAGGDHDRALQGIRSL